MEQGVYETLITSALEREISLLQSGWTVTTEALSPAEASERISDAIRGAISRALDSLPEDQRLEKGLWLTSIVQSHLSEISAKNASELLIAHPAKILKAVGKSISEAGSQYIHSPLIPLHKSELLVNSQGELRVSQALSSEMSSADQVDVIIAFVRMSGIRPLLSELRSALSRGTKVRLITTTYTGSTEPAALEMLKSIGCEIKVSYETGSTRLHAKSWIFYRNTGFSTAYIGSSNLSYSALQTGLEWNIRISTQTNPLVLEKMAVLFETYWNSPEFEYYEKNKFALEIARPEKHQASLLLPNLDLRLEPFQERLLEQIALARSQGKHKNLLVAATGTGKTVMAAADYRELRKSMPRANLLFIAHREELLDQSLNTFRYALKEASFGEKMTSESKPLVGTNVFASIQSLHEKRLATMDPQSFDVIVIDEFHHAAAPSYRRILDYFSASEWLGLTATPERSDGLPIIELFGGKIAAELRLWDAIDQGRLVPFAYFGVSDGQDLTQISWRRGSGYDVNELTELYASSPTWLNGIIENLEKYVGLNSNFRALGFCVSVAHAEFMSSQFNLKGIRATFVSGESTSEERRKALHDLKNGAIKLIFSVDLFNEGVDVPEVDVLLMLRPTDSPVLFLQQIGRGLRKSSGKSSCTIIDFVSNHRKEFRFDRKLGALLPGNRVSLISQVESGFPLLPSGCHMELDQIAAEIVLDSIKNAMPTTWRPKVEACKRYLANRNRPTLAEFLEVEGLELEAIYEGGHSWSQLLRDAGYPNIAAEKQHERSLRRALVRLLHIDDPERIAALKALARGQRPAELNNREKMAMELVICNLANQLPREQTATINSAHQVILDCPAILGEINELAELLSQRQSHLTSVVDDEIPLRINARYTRVEIFAAYGYRTGANVVPWQSGVQKVERMKTDLLAITLDKSADSFTERTSYKDYALSRTRFHWESQADTAAESETGRRYVNHKNLDWKVQLFVRKSNTDRAFWYIGPADYVDHRGSRPMAITWELSSPLPGDLYQEFAAAVVTAA